MGQLIVADVKQFVTNPSLNADAAAMMVWWGSSVSGSSMLAAMIQPPGCGSPASAAVALSPLVVGATAGAQAAKQRQDHAKQKRIRCFMVRISLLDAEHWYVEHSEHHCLM